MISVPIVLLILPTTFFDHGQAICLSKLLLNKTCPGCGLTRGVQHLIHFDFSGAYAYNKLTYIVFPIAAFYWVKSMIKLVHKIKNT
jgi:hypothetical protein